jgi:hypothetical protein
MAKPFSRFFTSDRSSRVGPNIPSKDIDTEVAAYAKAGDYWSETAAREHIANHGALVFTQKGACLIRIVSNEQANKVWQALRIAFQGGIVTPNNFPRDNVLEVKKNVGEALLRCNPNTRFAAEVADNDKKAVFDVLLGRRVALISGLETALVKSSGIVLSSAANNLGRVFCSSESTARKFAMEIGRHISSIARQPVSFGKQNFFEITPLPTPCRVALSGIPESNYHIRLPANADPLQVAANRFFSSTTDLTGVTAPRPTS